MRFPPRRYHCPSKGKWDIANWEEVKWEAMKAREVQRLGFVKSDIGKG